MADEPTLPRLPVPTESNQFTSRPLFNNGRKRAFVAPPPHFSTSSDPAVFSSDDDPALDNYNNHGRRKKRYVGTWFDQHPASSDSADSAIGDDTRLVAKPRQRQLRRQLDSGVWMAQGESTDTDEFVEMEPAASKLPMKRAPPLYGPRLSTEAMHAQTIVRGCVDNGIEAIDLSQIGLLEIPNEILEPIPQITPIPNVQPDVPFEQREPRIQLFLGNNAIKEFPSVILSFEHLTVLSIRANCLSEIPPGLAKLKNLQSLNVANNRLRYLPGELLDLLRPGSTLRDIQVHPNPFYQPLPEPLGSAQGQAEYEAETFRLTRKPEIEVTYWEGVVADLRTRTPVQFSDTSRNVHSEFKFPQGSTFLPLSDSLLIMQHEPFFELAVPKIKKPVASRMITAQDERIAQTAAGKPVGARSLFELALRAAARHPHPETVKALLSEDYIPEHFLPAFERASKFIRMGGQNCCVCGRDTINPLTEWIEFHEMRRTSIEPERSNAKILGSRVPFMRRGCSWQCIPFKGPRA